MSSEMSLLLNIAKNEEGNEASRFNAAVTLAQLHHAEDAIDAFYTISRSRNVSEDVRKSATEAVEIIRRGQVPRDLPYIGPAPPRRPTRPL